MTLDTDLSRKPYFDDFDQTKNFYRVLYKPAVAVQARELNQMQTILQDQIDKFGRFVFKDGSVVEGCAFSFENKYAYVKINDNFANNSAIPNVVSFQSAIVTNSNGLKAVVVNTVGGYQSQAPNLNTLYIKYLNASTYTNGSIQTVFSNNEVLALTTSSNVAIGNVTVSPVANSTGYGYAFTTTEGVIFKKGFFIRVAPQTLIVSKYDNVPNAISVGFEADESITTSNIDTTLLDNAAGSPNYDAPGADRFVLTPTLITRAISDTTNPTTFFSLCDFKNGLPVSIKNDPQLAALGKESARRTFETNGDYIVNPFLLSTDKKYSYTSNTANASYLSIVSSPGIGYVKGYRVEFINNNTADIRKATDYVAMSSQIVTANFGYYFNVNEFCGDFNNDGIAQIEFHNQAKSAITGKTFLSTTSYSSTTKIGTAYVRGVAYDSGIPGVSAVYRLYVFGVSMSAGQKIDNVRSVIYYNGSIGAVADIVLDKDFNGVSIAKIQESSGESMIYPFGQKAIRPEGFSSSAQYVYRNRANSTFLAATGGSLALSLSAAVGTGSENFNYSTSVLSQPSEYSFVVIPTATGYSTNKTANVNVSGTSVTNASAVSTAFSSEYIVGDYVYANTQTRCVVSITNNTLMTVDTAFTTATNISHQKTWPAGVPINFSSPTRTINITSSTTANIALGDAINADFTASVYFDILRSGTVPIAKNVNKSTYIKIQANTNAGGTTGPWCLGIPDVIKINSVYVDDTGGSYLTTNPDRVTSFRLDNGQRDSYYGLSYISTTSPIAPNATLLVSVDNFVAAPSQGVGFFTAASYPIDDANTSNTSAIQIYQIPQYTSTIGKLFDLRDSVDFRPYAVNNAVANASSIGSATVNPANTLTLYSYGSNGAYFPTPGTNYQSTIQFYLPRKDRIALTTSGEILVSEGTAASNPAPPPEVPGTMTIGIATVAPYPSLTPTEAKTYNRYDYAVQTSILQTKRYTMADINKINTRIDRLEYYTSLSLLEQATSSLLVRSGDTGQNRFKNGILVDPFKNHSIGNTNDPSYMIAIDETKAEARPYFRQQTIGMRFDANSSTAVIKGGVVMLPHTTNTVNQQQPFASKFRNCIEGNIYNYRGTVVLDPPGILDSDITQNPVINSSLDLSSNWVNLANTLNSMFGTQYGNWTNYGTAQVVGQQASDNQVWNSGGNYSDGQLQSWQTNVTTTLAQQQQQINKSFSSASSENNINLGNYVTDVSVQNYVPARQIFFYVKGMKPSTRLYVYLAGITMDQDVLPLAPYTGTLYPSGGNNFTDTGSLVYISRSWGNYKYANIQQWGTAVYSDASGNAYGIMAIPAGVFKSGELEFRITDISNLILGEDAVTTQTSTTLFCSPLAVQKSKANLQIRSGTINIEEEKLNRTLYQNQVTTDTWQYFDRDIPNLHCPPENEPPNISQISQGYGPPRR